VVGVQGRLGGIVVAAAVFAAAVVLVVGEC